jgi:predicted CopG family antitoxin
VSLSKGPLLAPTALLDSKPETGYTAYISPYRWSIHMHRTTINVSEPVFQQARIKALREGLSVSEVIREMLARWVEGEIDLAPGDRSRQQTVALARSARGMWALSDSLETRDQDPDDYLAESRAGLKKRDEELAHARLDA